MKHLTKFTFILLAAILIALSLTQTCPASAQPAKPSTPEFTAKYVVHKIYVTPTSTVDPYSGVETKTDGYYAVDGTAIEFTIKNQPFTPYTDSEGRTWGMYYNFRIRGHFGGDWSYYPVNQLGISSRMYGGIDFTSLVPIPALTSETTVISLDRNSLRIPDYGQVDVQVQSQFGYYTASSNDPYIRRVYLVTYNFTGQSSDWGTMQTIAISDNPDSPDPTLTPSPTPVAPSPTVPELPFLAVVSILIVLMLAASAVTLNKSKINGRGTNPSATRIMTYSLLMHNSVF